jgi:hypothetical protein
MLTQELQCSTRCRCAGASMYCQARLEEELEAAMAQVPPSDVADETLGAYFRSMVREQGSDDVMFDFVQACDHSGKLIVVASALCARYIAKNRRNIDVNPQPETSSRRISPPTHPAPRIQLRDGQGAAI